MSDMPFTTPEYDKNSEAPSSISILINIITAPHKAFKDIQFSYPILLPILSILFLNALLVFIVFSSMDMEWYVNTIVEQSAGEMSKAEQDSMRVGLEMFGSIGLSIFAVLGSVIGIAIIFCLFAVYFVIVSKTSNDGFQFGQWFSFISWTSIPSLIGVFASFFIILTSSNNQISIESLNPLSLNALFFDMNPFVGLGKVLSSIDLTTFWTLALMVIGYAKWTQSSYAKSFIIVFIPYVLSYGASYLMS